MSARREGGFTLFELMTVMVILGLMAIIFSQALPFIEQVVRDNRRLHDLASMQRVIEVYKVDNGSYPTMLPAPAITAMTNQPDPAFSPWSPSVNINYIPKIVPTYYESLPQDPMPGESTISGCLALGWPRDIAYISNGDHYKLVFNCSSERNDYSMDSRFYDPARPDWAWSVSDNMEYTTSVLGW